MKKNSPSTIGYLAGGAAGPGQHLAEAELALLGGLDALGGRHRPHPPDAVGVDAQAGHAGDGALGRGGWTCECAVRVMTGPPWWWR